MKKILFLQLESDAYGGVWFVNKTLGEKFADLGYDVKLIGIRKRNSDVDLGTTSIKIETVNCVDKWVITHRRDVLNSLKEIKFFRTLYKYIIDLKKLKKDYNTLKSMIREYDPDYIIASHYGVLEGIPSEYLKRTIHIQHSSFKFIFSDSKNIKMLKRYNNKLFKLIWLSNSICKDAIEYGFTNSISIYNPTRFSADDIADVVKNKKIVVVTRISYEKRLIDMLKAVNNVLEKHKDWKFEIYGTGEFDLESEKIIKINKNIIYKGKTDDIKKVFLSSSINLNTSEYEGFPLSVIEGLECGVPIISYNNSESINEEIKDEYNGYIVEYKNIKQFSEKLEYLINNSDILNNMSKNAKEFSSRFSINTIIKEWENLFNEME